MLLSRGLGSSAGYKFSVVRSRWFVADVDDSCGVTDCNYFSSNSSHTKSREYQRMLQGRPVGVIYLIKRHSLSLSPLSLSVSPSLFLSLSDRLLCHCCVSR